MDFEDYLKIMVAKDASDIYLTTGAPPSAKFQGVLKPIDKTSLSGSQVKEMANSIMDDEQKAQFANKPEMNLALSRPGVGRFRVNIFKQRNQYAMVIRNIKTDIPQMDELGLPAIFIQTHYVQTRPNPVYRRYRLW